MTRDAATMSESNKDKVGTTEPKPEKTKIQVVITELKGRWGRFVGLRKLVLGR